MTLDEIEHALKKQLTPGSDTLVLETECGSLLLDGAIGRKTIKVVRLILSMERNRLKKESKRG